MNKNIKLLSLTVCLLLNNLAFAEEKKFVHPDIQKNIETKNLTLEKNESLNYINNETLINNDLNKIKPVDLLKNSKEKNLEIKKLELKVVELNHKILELQNMTSILIEKINNNTSNIKIIDKISKNEINLNDLKQNNFNNFKNKNVKNFIDIKNKESLKETINKEHLDIKENDEVSKKRDTKSNISIPEEQKISLITNNELKQNSNKDNKQKNKKEEIKLNTIKETNDKKVEVSQQPEKIKTEENKIIVQETKQDQEDLIKKLKEKQIEEVINRKSKGEKIIKVNVPEIISKEENLKLAENKHLMIGSKDSGVILFKDINIKTKIESEKNYINDNLLIYKTVVDKSNSIIKTQDKQIKNVYIRNEKNEKIGSIINGTPIDYEEFNETYYRIKNKFYIK